MKEVNLYGKQFIVTEEPVDVWQWIETKGWEASTFCAMDRFLTKDSVFVDVGAWIGTMSMYAARVCKQVVAFEPDPVAFHIASANFAANRLSNVHIYNVAVSNQPGSIKLGAHWTVGCSVTREGCNENVIEVPTVTLSGMPIEEYMVIKIDAEGMERLIFEDASFFEKHKPDVILSTHEQWWKDNRVDVDAAYNTIKRVARFYKNVYDISFNQINLDQRFPTDIILTDKTCDIH